MLLTRRKRTRSEAFSNDPWAEKRGIAKAKRRQLAATRAGYTSVARTRGAAVTGEMKYYDTLLAASALTATNNWTTTVQDPATFNCLCAPTVGAAINQRIGRQIHIHKVKVNGFIHCPSQADQTAMDHGAIARIMLVQDKQTNATQMDGNLLMTDMNNAIDNINSFQNVDNFGRFKVLKDKFIPLNTQCASYDGTNIEQAGLVRRFKFSHRFRTPVCVHFNATNGGSVADIVDNSFHIIAATSQTSQSPSLYYCARVCYKE